MTVEKLWVMDCLELVFEEWELKVFQEKKLWDRKVLLI